MENSKKYHLIPFDRIQQFEEEHMSQLDFQMEQILKRKMDVNEKAKLYIQVLQKYVTFPNLNSVKSMLEEELPVETKTPNNEMPKNKTILMHPKIAPDVQSSVIQTVPIRQEKTALKILDFLKQNQIVWTENNELLVEDKVIPQTNIVELINFLVRRRKRRPVGFEQFQSLLKTKQFPQELIKNTSLLDEKTMYARPNLVKRNLPRKVKWLTMY